MRASTNLHNLMYNGVTRATMYFFNTNPSGRILNRFSKDMGQIDEILPAVMIDVIQIFLQLGGIIIVVAIVNYWFLIPTAIIGVIFYYLRNFYLMSSRNIKRMEATSKYKYTFILLVKRMNVCVCACSGVPRRLLRVKPFNPPLARINKNT